jgi:hypothetical protein
MMSLSLPYSIFVDLHALTTLFTKQVGLKGLVSPKWISKWCPFCGADTLYVTTDQQVWNISPKLHFFCSLHSPGPPVAILDLKKSKPLALEYCGSIFNSNIGFRSCVRARCWAKISQFPGSMDRTISLDTRFIHGSCYEWLIGFVPK